MKIIKSLISQYSYKYPEYIVYMLQSCEYRAEAYWHWLNKVSDFSQVMKRRHLDRTKAATALLLMIRIGILLQLFFGSAFLYEGLKRHTTLLTIVGIDIILFYPIFWAYIIIFPLWVARYLIVLPNEHNLIKRSEEIFKNHPAKKIAIIGSYGKTTFKEMLLTVLSEGLNVAATPANKNVSVSHAIFANDLNNKEDLLIIEYGEGQPGDIAKFAKTTHPSEAVITGLAPAHLDRYHSLSNAAKDLFSIKDFVSSNKIYVNVDSLVIQEYLKDYDSEFQRFNRSGAMGWKVDNPLISLNGLQFNLIKGNQTIKLKSSLLGRHHLSSLSFIAAYALSSGLTSRQVEQGIAKTKPFEHRMQPYKLNGATVIDDTYNGNIEGIRVGTAFLNEIKAKRKIYVTPGLVDQGKDTASIHIEVGRLIAKSKADIVVLMNNSVVDYIKKGLEQVNFLGQIRIESDPLNFYLNLKYFVAAGDVVLMQNDWTDNYQ